MFDRIPDITAQRALLKPEAVAFRDLVRGTALTYRELEARVRSLAGLMRAEGVGEGDRVAVICRNRVELFELLFAAGKLGAVLVPLNWRMPAAELCRLAEVRGVASFVDLGAIVAGPGAEPARVIGQVVTGVGFLGAGVMMTQDGIVRGVTTAAVIWMLAAIGATIGAGYYAAAVASSVATVGTDPIRGEKSSHLISTRSGRPSIG